MDLEKMLKTAEPKTSTSCKAIQIGKRKPCYRVYPSSLKDCLKQRRIKRRRWTVRCRAKREGKKRVSFKSTRYDSLDGYLYITNIEEHRLTPKQICVIVGIRWQIEFLMYKCFKSIGKLQSSTKSETLWRHTLGNLCQTYRTSHTA